MLELAARLPTREVAAGEPLFGPDVPASTVVVLVDGRFRVTAGTATLSVMDAPGSFIGEIGALLGVRRSADVVAERDSTVKVIGDPEAFFAEHPQLGLELARQLAGRLHRLTAYLGDVRTQYADREDHLGMVDSVLARIATAAPVEIEPGSDRAPDY